MKLALPVIALWLLFALSLFGCDEPVAREAARAEVPKAATGSENSTSWADAIRSRADAAFSEARSEPEASGIRRSESRIGAQPWPDDLPAPWPRLVSGTVVADTRQSGGERLLLVNFPGSPDQTLGSIRTALLERGYRVDRPELRRDRRALHAEGKDHEAVLTFYPREQVTRVEILILARATG